MYRSVARLVAMGIVVAGTPSELRAQTTSAASDAQVLRLSPMQVLHIGDCLLYTVILNKPSGASGSPRAQMWDDFRRRFFEERCDQISSADWQEFVRDAERYVKSAPSNASRYQELFRAEKEQRREAESKSAQ